MNLGDGKIMKLMRDMIKMIVLQCTECHRICVYPNRITRNQCGCRVANMYLDKVDGVYYKR